MKFLSLIFFVFFIFIPLKATLVALDSIQTMTKQSSVIVEAKIVRQEVKEDAHGRIITLSTLQVQDGLKGAWSGQELILYQVGGEYRGRVMRMQGASVYRKGEHIMLFAVPYEDKMIVGYGLGLGKFQISQKTQGDQVIEELRGLEVLQMKGGRRLFTQAEGRRFKTLKAFKDQIREAL